MTAGVLSTTFSDFEVTMDATSAEPVVTKTFSMTLPLTDGANRDVVCECWPAV